MAEVLLEGLSPTGFRRLFYVVTPGESSFQRIEDVPDYIKLAVPWFLLFVAVEFVLAQLDASKRYALNDSMTSVGGGMLQTTIKILTRGAEFRLYVAFWNRYHMVELPWDWWGTWVAAFLTVDFGYYLFHRAGHETLIGWAFHQMHHSSEYYNFSTALRQGAIQGAFSCFFYLPFAFFVPPPAFLAHQGLNVLYQFWIHTQYIRSLGPLEWIINTPSHHRVHHGRNPYCIDKNYAGTLIIWDRLLGTFTEERAEEEIAYGLTHPLKSFAPVHAQTFLLVYALWTRPRQMYRKRGLAAALQVPFRGPGWGHPPVKPVTYPVQRYDPPLPAWLSLYAFAHFMAPLGAFVTLAAQKDGSSWWAWGVGAFILCSLHSLGLLLDRRAHAESFEFARVTAVAAWLCLSWGQWHWLTLAFAASTLLWTTRLLSPRQKSL